MRRKTNREKRGRMEPGQDIVVIGFAGMAGARVIALEKEEELSHYFSPSYVKQIQTDSSKGELISRDPEQWERLGVTEWERSGPGGILTSLWNLSGTYGVGIRFTLRQIPVKQSTIEVCEYYGLNPYRLFSKGCVLLIGDHGERLVEGFLADGIPAALIGQVIPGNQMEIITEEGTACLDRPQKDELEKIIPGFHYP